MSATETKWPPFGFAIQNTDKWRCGKSVPRPQRICLKTTNIYLVVSQADEKTKKNQQHVSIWSLKTQLKTEQVLVLSGDQQT